MINTKVGRNIMAMPQRDETIEEIKRLDALLEYAVMHGDEAEAARELRPWYRGETRLEPSTYMSILLD